MIYFSDIFERAVTIFDDPDIRREYFFDQAAFQKNMLNYLIIGKNKFISPSTITDKLTAIDPAQGKIEEDNGDGSNTYALESEIPNNGKGVGFTYRINGNIVHGEYDAENKSVIFERNVESTEKWSVAWFYAGAFTADFSNCLRSDFSMSAIMEKVVNILAYALLSAWGDEEVDRVVEVRNILTDTDFDMYSPANSARAKVEWRNQMNRDMDTLVSELNWLIMSTPRGGSRFGK